MKIFIFRHCERHPFSTINLKTNLTSYGLKQSIEITNFIKNNKIRVDEIYSSPYLRCVQSCLSLSVEFNKKIKTDFRLGEILTFDKYPLLNFYSTEMLNNINQNNLNLKYINHDIEFRTIHFLKDIFDKYINTDKNIFIFSHKGFCKQLVKYILKEDFDFNMGQGYVIYPYKTNSLIIKNINYSPKIIINKNNNLLNLNNLIMVKN